MLSGEAVGALTQRLIEARQAGDKAALVDLIDGLLTGPRGDSLNVALMLAGILAEEIGCPGGCNTDADVFDFAEAAWSEPTPDLPLHVVAFAEMVVALTHADRDLARDLFLAYARDDLTTGRRVSALLVFALNEVANTDDGCDHREVTLP